jgi:hypothetical protein
MKKISFLLIFCLVLACKSKKISVDKRSVAALERLSDIQVDKAQKDKTTVLGKQILMTCNTSKFIPFTEKEATAEVRKNMTLQRLSKICAKFQQKYGDFKELKFVEAYKDNTNQSIIYRYKALYEKKIANKELRLTVNKNNQIAAVNSKDWKDIFSNK